jgi:hypothetical protein
LVRLRHPLFASTYRVQQQIIICRQHFFVLFQQTNKKQEQQGTLEPAKHTPQSTMSGHGGSRKNAGRKRATSSELKEKHKSDLAIINPYDPKKKRAVRLVAEAEEFEATEKRKEHEAELRKENQRRQRAQKDAERKEKEKELRILDEAQRQVAVDNGLERLAEAVEPHCHQNGDDNNDEDGDDDDDDDDYDYDADADDDLAPPTCCSHIHCKKIVIIGGCQQPTKPSQ